VHPRSPGLRQHLERDVVEQLAARPAARRGDRVEQRAIGGRRVELQSREQLEDGGRR
jgi:hypothetical protein